MLQQVRSEPVTSFLLRLAVSTGIYFQLSVFQSHHAQVRVLRKRPSEGRAGVPSPVPRQHGPLPSAGRPACEAAPLRIIS